MSNNTVPTPITDKNGKNTTVHKRVDKPTPPSRTVAPKAAVAPRDENVVIEQVIADFVEEGVLTDVGGEWETDRVYLGTSPSGLQISAQIVVFEKKNVTTTELEKVEKAWAIDISGSGAGKNGDWAAGLLVKELNEGLEDGTLSESNTKRFAELWEKFNNHSRLYGTELQYQQEAELHAAGVNMHDDNWGEWSHLINDDRGFIFGSDTLHRPITADELAEFIVLLDMANVEVEQRREFSLHKFATEGREQAISEGNDPDAISPRSIHGNLTYAQIAEIDLARADLDHLEHLDYNDADDVALYGSKEKLMHELGEATSRFYELNSQSN